jgi:hypothetical protein
MGQITSAVSNVRSAFQLKVSARGALIRSIFGSNLMYWAVMLSGKPTPLRFFIVTVPTLGLIVWAIILVRTTRHLPSSTAELDHWRSVRKFYWLDVGLEWVLIGVAVLTLAQFSRFDLIPQALGVIVGVHYLPLGKIFYAKQYYWTGGVMVAVALGSLLISRGQIRNIFGCVAVGLTLWVSSFAILWWIAAALRGRTHPNVL